MSTLSHRRGRIELVCGNIVDQDTDALVNAANTKLKGGGGVDGAIHRAAGKSLLEECLKLPADEKGRRCPTGDVRITSAGNLKARFVIHAVGPFYNDRYAEKNAEQLRQVHHRALAVAVTHGCRSIAFPAISTGAYRFPLRAAATIAIGTATDFLAQNEDLELVRFVLFKPAHFEVFRECLG